MIVIADTSPINYLILIDEIALLPRIFGKIVIPSAVYEELLRPSAPKIARSWKEALPTWLEIGAPKSSADASLNKLGPGERDAILLAGELGADALIIDDRLGRLAAERRGIKTIGTLAVLQTGAALGLLDLHDALKRLEQTNFYIAPEILARLFREKR